MPSRIALLDVPPSGSGLGRIARFIRRHYAPVLLRPVVKGLVLLTFAGMFVASVISMQHIQLGLGEFEVLTTSYGCSFCIVRQINDLHSRQNHTSYLTSTT